MLLELAAGSRWPPLSTSYYVVACGMQDMTSQVTINTGAGATAMGGGVYGPNIYTTYTAASVEQRGHAGAGGGPAASQGMMHPVRWWFRTDHGRRGFYSLPTE